MEHNQGRHLPSNIGGAWDIRKGEQEKGRKEEQGEKEKEKKEKRETLGKANWCLHVWWGLSLQSLYPIGAPVQNKLSICSV